VLLDKDRKVDYLENTELWLKENEIKRLKARIEELEKELEEK
jgi:16S rRNA G527 N7-methylase RsmG